METYYVPGVYRDTDGGEKVFGKAIPACPGARLRASRSSLLAVFAGRRFQRSRGSTRTAWVR